MTRRNGTTLIEVLMAIFIMAIGLTSIMALFPVGAVSMARAVQDVRSADSAANAVSMFRMRWKRALDEGSDPASRFYRPISMHYPMPTKTDGMVYPPEPFIPALDNPRIDITGNGLAGTTTSIPKYTLYHPSFAGKPANDPARSAGLLPTDGHPSFPVLIDPVGYIAQGILGQKQQNWLPTSSKVPNFTPMPRRTVTDMTQLTSTGLSATAAANALPLIDQSKRDKAARMCTMLDDMTFDTQNGTPKPGLERKGKYTWSWLARRDSNSKRKEVSLSVLVFRDRSINLPATETPMVVRYYSANPNEVRFYPVDNNGAAPPTVRKGTWLLDSSISDQRVEGFFYRVVNVSESISDNTGTSIRYEFQSPIRNTATQSSNRYDTRLFIFLDGLVEVFEKGPIDSNSTPRPY